MTIPAELQAYASPNAAENLTLYQTRQLAKNLAKVNFPVTEIRLTGIALETSRSVNPSEFPDIPANLPLRYSLLINGQEVNAARVYQRLSNRINDTEALKELWAEVCPGKSFADALFGVPEIRRLIDHFIDPLFD